MDCTICANEVSRRAGFSASASTGPSFPASTGGRSKTRNGWVGARMEPHMCNRPDVHGIVVWTCIPSATQVVVRIAAAPRPPGRRCRAGNGGRDRSDPPLSMPAVASAEVGMCTPSHPPRGSLRSSDPLREGQRASRFGSSRSRSAMSNSPTSASRSANGCSAAARRRSAPFRDGSLDRSDPKGSWAGVRKPTRPRTRTEPSAKWVLRSRPEWPVCHGRAGGRSWRLCRACR